MVLKHWTVEERIFKMEHSQLTGYLKFELDGVVLINRLFKFFDSGITFKAHVNRHPYSFVVSQKGLTGFKYTLTVDDRVIPEYIEVVSSSSSSSSLNEPLLIEKA